MDEASRELFRLSSGQFRALYAAGVVGLLTFVAVALLFPAPIHSYRSRAVVAQTALIGHQAPVEIDLLTLAMVQQQAEESLRGLSTSKAFAEAVTCQVERPTPNQARITIEASDRYAEQSLELCRRIADDVVRNAEPSFVPGMERLSSERANVQQRLAMLRQSKRIAEDELTALTRDHITRVTSAVDGASAAHQLADSDSPERQRLNSEWQRLISDRNELTLTKTDQHPQIKDIDQRLAETKKRIDALAVASHAGQPAMDRFQEEYRRRSQELTDAISEYRRREDELLSEAAQLAATPAPIALSTAVVQPPELIDRIGGQPSVFQVTILIVLSVTAGGFTYRLLRQWLARQKFSSAQDIQDQLELPVISLAASHGHSSSKLIRRSLLAAEGSLAVIAVMTFLLVALQPKLTRPMSADPFGAVAESLDRTFAPTLRR